MNSAGSTDSALTNHGVLQAERLGDYLAKTGLRFTKVFSSDLQRAKKTADAICAAQCSKHDLDSGTTQLETIVLPVLREQDFGSAECRPWVSKPVSLGKAIGKTLLAEGDPGFVAKETYESMALRLNSFIDGDLVPLLASEPEMKHIVAVVSHGITLSVLWRILLLRFSPRSVSLAPKVDGTSPGRGIEYLPSWMNTAYLELDITPLPGDKEISPSIGARIEPSSAEPSQAQIKPFAGWGMTVHTVNGREHLRSLKRTRGGVGSSIYDEKQQKLDGFFKKEKPDI